MSIPAKNIPVIIVAFSTSIAFGAEVLFVVGKQKVAAGKKDLRTSDISIKNHLINRGFDIVVLEDTDAKSEDAVGKDLVILSESARSREVGTKFRAVPVPVICSEPWLFRHLGMTGHTRKADFGRKSRQKKVLIINPEHPLCAGCSE